MSTVISIVAPTLFGASEVSRKHASKWALLFASVGVAAGINGIRLALKGEMDKALLSDATSIIFDLMSILKALEVL